MSALAPVGAALLRPLPEHPRDPVTAAPVAGRPPDPETESAITRAALRACTIYPGPVAQLVREILGEPADVIDPDVGSPDAA